MILSSGDWELDLDTVQGGMIRALRRGGRNILRPMPRESTVPFESACFPLAPYVNRIAHGRFEWGGTGHHLPPNYPGQRHPLHGTAWLGEWQLVEADDRSASLSYTHVPDEAWPWPFALVQRLILSDAGLDAGLSIIAADEGPMPVGIGFHPWFARDGVQSVAFEAKSVWLADEDMLPTQTASADALGDWRDGGSVERPDLVDHCYTGWNGILRIAREDGAIVLTGRNTPFLHLCIPPGADFFCAEPQTTIPDAIHHPPVDVLDLSETMTIGMQILSA